MKTNNKYTLRLSACALALILNPSHGIELFNWKVGNEHVKVSVGGYAKVDVRHVEGDIAYQDYWIGNFPGGDCGNGLVHHSVVWRPVSDGDAVGFFWALKIRNPPGDVFG